jgi:hypothetical protein
MQALVLLDMEKISAPMVSSVTVIVIGTAAASYGALSSATQPTAARHAVDPAT